MMVTVTEEGLGELSKGGGGHPKKGVQPVTNLVVSLCCMGKPV